MNAEIHTADYGTEGPRVVFCHGLFGQGRNWTHIARSLADAYRVTLLDLPNHGRSAWTDRIDYLQMADAVAALASEDDPIALVGHSLGGKVAMALALRHPDVVAKLCVVDIAPAAHSSGSEFRRYIDAMQQMDLATIHNRQDAEDALTEAVPDASVRAFLLQNLRRDGASWRWQANLDLLGRDLETIAGWPAALRDAEPYRGPVLWLAGANSDYITEDDAPVMRKLFPRVHKISIKGAGHWVHADQPEIFLNVVRGFLAASQ